MGQSPRRSKYWPGGFVRMGTDGPEAYLVRMCIFLPFLMFFMTGDFQHYPYWIGLCITCVYWDPVWIQM